MNAKRLLLMVVMVLATTLMFYSMSFAVSLAEGYDDEILTQEGTTSWEDDLEALEEREIERILMRIRAGDTNVLNYIVYQVYERLHFTVLAVAVEDEEERQLLIQKLNARYPDENAELFIERAKRRYSNLEGLTYYRIMGYRNSIPAFIAGFNNQDPKVRLKVIGYLGDWVDEVGLDLVTIETAAALRIGSGLETREEVKYALEILRLKILRKRILKQIYIGNTNVLDEIPATDFVVLVKNEVFIRDIYNIAEDVVIGSIRLDPYMGRVRNKEEAVDNNNVPDKLWRLDSYDFNYNNRNAYKAIFEGCKNPSLFVRENCVRLLLEITLVPSGTDDPNQGGQNNIEIAEIDTNGRVITGVLADISKQAYYIRCAQKLWDDVQFATFNNYEGDIRFTGNPTNYYQDDLIVSGNGNAYGWATTERQAEPHGFENHVTSHSSVQRVNEGDGTELTVNELGHYNYRIMVADLLRLMGLKWYLGEAEYREMVIAEEQEWSVYTLFDREIDETMGGIDRHDTIQGEAPSPSSTYVENP